MKIIWLRILKLFGGLFLYAVGIVFTVNANIGLAPWEAFHQGISKTISITMGQASIAMGLIVVIANSIMKERLGLGTLANMLFIGLFMDLLMLNHLIPIYENIVAKVVMMVLGMFAIGVATYLYIGAGWGAGPRDGLMVALTKKTGKSVRLIRGAIETCVVILGYLMGGSIGAGTLIMALFIGFFVQLAFQLFKFDVTEVKHRFIDEDLKAMKVLLIDRINQRGSSGS